MARGIKAKMITGSQSATGSFTQLLFSGSTTCPRIEFGNLVNPVDNSLTAFQSVSHRVCMNKSHTSYKNP